MPPTTPSSQMMKDLDLTDAQAKGNGKIRLSRGCKRRFMEELRADAEFLWRLGLMDYSLLVGSCTFPCQAENKAKSV